MTTLLLAFVLYFFFCAFTYQPAATGWDVIESKKEWTLFDNTITYPAAKAMPVCKPIVTSMFTTEEAIAGLMTYTIRELKQIASTYKVKGYGRMTKTQLCKALEAIGCA